MRREIDIVLVWKLDRVDPGHYEKPPVNSPFVRFKLMGIVRDTSILPSL